MNKDIRIKTSFPTHYKTENLIDELGHVGYYSLTRLWCFAAEYKPKGVFTGMSPVDIARASGWKDDPAAFVDALMRFRFMTCHDGVYALHDWSEHNRFVFFSEERSEKARKSIENRWNNTNRIRTVQDHDRNRIRTVYESNTDGIRNVYEPYTSAIESRKDTSIEKKFAEADTTLYTPSPSPPPIPSPSPSHKKTTSVTFDSSTGKFLNLNGDVDYYKEQFPAVNVAAEIKAMEAWLFANPANRKSNYRRFIVNWLKDAQDKARPKDPSKRKTWRDVI